MLFDTDVLIWLLRGNPRARDIFDGDKSRCVSIVTYMELLQGARNRNEVKNIKSFLIEFAVEVVPLSENIGFRASIYMEEYAISTSICLADALIAATAVEYGINLCTGNLKHYRPIKDLTVRQFKHSTD